jgi:serine O-acetyltransferase
MQIKSGAWGVESPNRIEDRRTDAVRSGDPGRTVRPGRRDAFAPELSQSAFSSRGLSRLIYQDYRRYRAAGARSAISVIALTQGFWASAVFRFFHWALDHCSWWGLRAIVNAVAILCQKFVEVFTGIGIPATCNIGPGLYIGHFSGIFIDSECRVGENCNLAQGVTIGKGGRAELRGVPTLGDRVHVGAGALILGGITIGNDAVIGPGAVVMNSVPPCGVAMGNPARVVGLDGSFELVHYDNMESDPGRKLALQDKLAGSHQT